MILINDDDDLTVDDVKKAGIWAIMEGVVAFCHCD